MWNINIYLKEIEVELFWLEVRWIPFYSPSNHHLPVKLLNALKFSHIKILELKMILSPTTKYSCVTFLRKKENVGPSASQNIVLK